MMPETLTQSAMFRFDQMAVQVKDKIDNPAEADVDRYVGLEHIDPESLKIRRWGATSDVESSKILFKTGDIIFGKRRAYQRKLAVADFDGICSAHAMVLRPKTGVVLAEFLPFFMKSDVFMERAVKISVGGLSPTINWRDLAKEEFALPPLQEQRRIAELLGACELVTQAARRAEEAMTRTFIAARHHLMSRFSSDIDVAGALPGGLSERCSEKTLADIVESAHGIVDGPFGSNLKSEHYRDAGYPVLQSAFIAGGTYDPDASDWVYVDESKFQEQYRSAVRPGDIAMVKVGVNCGACDIVPAEQPIGILAGNCLKLSPNREICDTQFLLHYLKWLHEVGLLERHVTSTQQRALTLGRLKGQKLLLPPIPEQRSVAASLDAFRCGVSASSVRCREAKKFASRVLMEVLT